MYPSAKHHEPAASSTGIHVCLPADLVMLFTPPGKLCFHLCLPVCLLAGLTPKKSLRNFIPKIKVTEVKIQIVFAKQLRSKYSLFNYLNNSKCDCGVGLTELYLRDQRSEESDFSEIDYNSLKLQYTVSTKSKPNVFLL